MPASSARLMTGRASSSVSTQDRQRLLPIPMAPKAMRETRKLLRPNRTYSISRSPQLETISGFALPDIAEARDLVWNPDVPLNAAAQRGVFQREEQRHVG